MLVKASTITHLVLEWLNVISWVWGPRLGPDLMLVFHWVFLIYWTNCSPNLDNDVLTLGSPLWSQSIVRKQGLSDESYESAHNNCSLCWHSKNTFSAHIMCALCTPPPHFCRALIQRSMHLYVSLHIPSLWLTAAIFMIWSSLTTRGKRLWRIIYEVPRVFRDLG